MKKIIVVVMFLLFLFSCEKRECKQCDVLTVTFYFTSDFMEPRASRSNIVLCDEALTQLNGKTVIEDYADSSIVRIINCN